MASLLSQAEITSCTGDLISHFDTFKRQIIVVKEDLRSFSSNSLPSFPGYQTSNLTTDVNYTANTGVFYGLKVGPGRLGFQLKEALQTNTPETVSYIKVQKDCKDFIKAGKTEKLIIDDINYGINSEEKVVNYLGLIYYQFDIIKQN
ncbi:MAG: hypothetical protein EKK57_08930 [Proteobacteria bacterium]|nr:MAG: hypothetical protein EKK57_08930 [Pseudomonadota bacterium]